MYDQLDKDYVVNIEEVWFYQRAYDAELQKLRKGIYKKYFEVNDQNH